MNRLRSPSLHSWIQALVMMSIAACSGGGSTSGGSSTGTPPSTTMDYSALKAKLQSYVDNGTVPGLVFILLTANGQLFSYSAGNLTEDSVIAIASASKAPTVAAIVTLADQGKFDLDQPVSNYFAGTINWPVDKAAITMRMLLNHTSGLPHLFAPGQPACLDTPVLITMQDCVQNIANAKLETTPGTAFGYGGSDYQVAGYVATILSGLAWQDFFNQRIVTPLGMSSFSFSLASQGDATNPNVAGGGNTSAKDYALFLQAVLNGGKNSAGQTVLSKQFLSQYGQSQIAGLPVTYTPETSDQPGYSYGWFIASPSLYPGSSGPEISDPGLYGSTPWVDLDVGYGAVLFIQSTVATGADIQNGVRPLILQIFGRN